MDKEELRDLVPDVYEEEKRIIKQAERQGKLVLFVGAGVSMASGIPSWSDLIREIAIRMKEYIGNNDKEDKEYLETLKSSIKTIESELSGKAINDDNNMTSALKSVNKTTSYIRKIIDEKDKLSLDPLIIPQYYYNKYGKHDYNELIYKILKKNEYIKTNSLHKLIYRFNCSHIITTNYDTLLEEAAKEAHEFVYVIKEDKDIAYRTGEKEIIKMHGDFDSSNFVLKEDDYLQYNNNFKLVKTYIKSLIAGNVVLFIGFSFEDQNLKQIFSWLRGLLREDLQRAFIIFTGNDYSQIQDEYLKNLGLNALYVKKKFNIDKETHTEQLKKILFWLQKENLTDEEKVMTSLRRLNEFNYIYSNYLQNCLKYIGMINSDCLNLHSREVFENNKNEITSILNKSIINRVSYSFFNFNNHTNFDDENITHQYLFNKIYEAIFLFDKDTLISIKNNLELNKENNLLEIAYIYFVLGDYIKTNNYLIDASNKFYKEHKSLWYLISSFDRKILGNLRFDFNIKEEDFKEIYKETSKIDLNRIIATIPNIDFDDNIFLKDIVDKTLPYKVLANLHPIANSVNQEANTSYTIYVGEPNYSKLRKYVRDYYDYVSLNFIFMGKFKEHVEIFQYYSKVMLQSIIAPKRNSANSFRLFNFDGGNVKLELLSDFDIYIILNYLKLEDLKSILCNNRNQKYITFTENGKKYLEKVLNIKNYLPCSDGNYYAFPNILLIKIVLLLNSNNITENMIKTLLIHFHNLSLINNNKLEYDLLLNLFFNILNELFEKKESFDFFDAIKTELNQFINKMVNNSLRGNIYNDYALDISLKIFCKINRYYSDPLIIDLINNDKYQCLAIIYNYTIDEYKKKIKEKYINWTCNPDEISDLDKFQKLFLIDIVNNNNEKIILSKLQSYDSNIKIQLYNKKELKLIESLINILITLVINNKTDNKETIIELISKFDINLKSKWLLDPVNFDYKDFKSNWLIELPDQLITQIFSIDIVKDKIKKRFHEQYSKNEIFDSMVLDIYFKYLV